MIGSSLISGFMLLTDEQRAGILKECRFRTSRSGGPGGQNVNKVETRVLLWWNPATSGWIGEDVRDRMKSRYGNRLDTEGELVLQSDRYSSQLKNREDVINRLYHLIETVLVPPIRRKATRPTRQSVEDRISRKQRRSDVKKQRKPVKGTEQEP
ncbi:MAG: aminoacyl-tRNA hydrolase [Bacteroidetes bacterium]|nr:aminoacyl-tRNA hydrolase [Bacteroidota bacterium]